jgi:hypothetical protein
MSFRPFQPFRPFGGGAVQTFAANYIARLEAADGQALETKYRDAIATLFADLAATPSPVGGRSNLDSLAGGVAILLAGPRTLAGAMVPMLASMPTPTPVNHVIGDISRTLGIAADGTTKYITLNWGLDANPQNDQSMGVYLTSLPTSGSPRGLIGGGPPAQTGATRIAEDSTTARSAALRSRSATVNSVVSGIALGLVGISRHASDNFVFRGNGSSSTLTRTSETPASRGCFVGALDTGSATNFSDQRTAFAFAGLAVGLADIDGILDTYIAAIA